MQSKAAVIKTVRVSDIMTRKVIALSAELGVGQAAEALTSARVSGAPVVEAGELVGVVTRANLIDVRHDADTGDRLTLVREVMTPLVYAVRPTDPVLFAARLMDHEGIHRVIVVDEAFRIGGILTAMDIVRGLARGAFIDDALMGARANRPPIEWVRLPRKPKQEKDPSLEG